MMSGARILICDDEPTFHMAVKHALKHEFKCASARHGDEALAILKNHPIDVILLDIQIRGPREGLEFIPRLLEIDPELSIMMTSGLKDLSVVREAIQLGAADYILKDFDPDELRIALTRVLERRKLLQRKSQQDFESARFQSQQQLVGESASIRALKKKIEKLRPSPINVVITGETGTGKEIVARNLRASLPDGTLAPFVAVDSSTIQSGTAESQLFGHERGAFTGADQMRKGIFEEANGGIVYFDEIGNMPLEIQSKLLRVLQEKEVLRLGSARAIQLDFRLICATNRDLDGMVRQGQFKEDLLHRLNVMTLELPRLKDHIEDLPLLVSHFLARQPGARKLNFTGDALRLMMAYPWPGNIRELSNLVAYVCTMAEETDIDVADLPPKIRDAARALETRAGSGSSFYEQVSRFESELLSREYGVTQQSVSQLAIRLGMDRSHLYSKLHEYGIHPRKARD